MIIDSTNNRTAIFLKPENITDGFLVGIIKEKLDNFKISYIMELSGDGKLKKIIIENDDFLKMLM
jgi:hypothetical protein